MTPRTRTLALVALFSATLGGTAEAGGSKKKQWFDAEAWEKGKSDGVVVTRERGVVVGPSRTRTAVDEAAQVWCLANAGDTLLAGTGSSGQIFKIGADGAKVFADTGALVVTDIAHVGTVTYAATIPDGRIYRVTDKGEVAVHVKLDDGYVWRLAAAGTDGSFYAATGPTGKVWKIDQNGVAQLFYQSFEKNVLALRTDDAGNVYLGGAPESQLVRVGPDGKGTILYDFDAAELRDLLVTPEGIVCALNGAEKETDAAAAGDEGVAALLGGDETQAPAAPGVPPAPKAAAVKKEAAAGGPLADLGAGGKGGRVVRLGPNGIERLLEREAGSVSALARDAKGWIYVASGPDGRVTRVRGNEQEVWVDLDEKNVLALLERDGSLVAVGTGDGAAVYKLAGRPAEIDEDESPTWRSEVLDAGALAKWGRLQATILGEGEAGASKEKPAPGVAFQVRTGNTKDPEKGGWTEWRDAANGAAVPAGETPTRFLQVRAAWKKPRSRLRELSLYYRPLNRKPRITEITVKSGLGDQLDLSSQLAALGAELEVDGRQVAGGAGALGDLVAGQPRKAAGGGAARLPSNPVRIYAKQISWKADDPDGDHLVYRVSVRRLGEETWTRLHERESWGRTDFTWLTESFPDGSYQVKVAASDSPDNPPDAAGGAAALETERVVGPFLVDNHPPAVELKVADGKVTGTASDSASSIARIEFSVDGSPWRQVAPTDGVLDSREEGFALPVLELKPGRHVISVRALDEAGNTGAASVDVEGAK